MTASFSVLFMTAISFRGPLFKYQLLTSGCSAVGFYQVRFRLHCIIMSINLLMVVACTWFKITQQHATGVFEGAVRSALCVALPSFLVYYWEADQREQLRTGKRLRGRALSRLKAKLKEV